MGDEEYKSSPLGPQALNNAIQLGVFRRCPRLR